jgi:hypothetical protein
MRRIVVGAWIVGAGIAVAGVGATVAGLTEAKAAGFITLFSGAALTFVGFILLLSGGIAYMKDRKTTRDADFLLNQQRSAREAKQHQIDAKRLDLELKELELREERHIRKQLDALNRNVTVTSSVEQSVAHPPFPASQAVDPETREMEEEVRQTVKRLTADGVIDNSFSPQQILDTLLRVWQNTDKAVSEKRQQSITADRATEIAEAITTKNGMKEQANKEALSPSPKEYLAEQLEFRREAKGTLPDSDYLRKGWGEYNDLSVNETLAHLNRLALLSNLIAEEEERTGQPVRPSGAIAAAKQVIAEEDELKRREGDKK